MNNKTNNLEIIKEVENLTAPLDANDLKLIRKSFAASQAQFSKILGVPSSSLKKWEQGERKADASTTSLYLMIAHIRKKQYFPCIMDWISKIGLK